MLISQQKREHLRRSVEALKENGITQRQIAERMGESEGALSGKLGGGRGITDDYLDKFGEAYGMPFVTKDSGIGAGLIAVDQSKFDDLLEQVKMQTRLLNALLDQLAK